METGELLFIQRERLRAGFMPTEFNYGIYLGAEPGNDPLILLRTQSPAFEEGQALIAPIAEVQCRSLSRLATVITIEGFIGFQLPDTGHIAMWMEPGWEAFQCRRSARARAQQQRDDRLMCPSVA